MMRREFIKPKRFVSGRVVRKGDRLSEIRDRLDEANSRINAILELCSVSAEKQIRLSGLNLKPDKDT